MTSTTTTTTYIYKICPSSPPIPTTPSNTLPKDYTVPASHLDTSSQFIHLSTASQVPGTLFHFFPAPAAQRASIVLLRLPYAPLEAAGVVRWESPDASICGPREGEGLFPHVYFADGRLGLGAEEVEGVREVVSEREDEGWEGALGRLEGWLV